MAAGLSSHDSAILNCVFNPTLPLDESSIQIQEELKDVEDLTPEVKRSKELEAEAVAEAESGNLEKALDLIKEAIGIAPRKPSLYNNRAYIYQYFKNFQDALDDLNTALNLSSEDHKRTLYQSHCQRGILYRKSNRIDEARADFEIAAKMGNQFAKGQLVELNPYAALCNQMLSQVFNALK